LAEMTINNFTHVGILFNLKSKDITIVIIEYRLIVNSVNSNTNSNTL